MYKTGPTSVKSVVCIELFHNSFGMPTVIEEIYKLSTVQSNCPEFISNIPNFVMQENVVVLDV